MNNQEAYNAALFGIRAQNYKQSVGNSGCLYRGPEGRKCGIGHSLPDDLVEQYMPDGSADTAIQPVLDTCEGIRSFYKDCSGGLLQDLQWHHDQTLANGANAFEREMQRIATIYDLTYTPPKEAP